MNRLDTFSDDVKPYREKLEDWASKELQLKMLHDEIIIKREALLRTSKNYLQRVSTDDLPINNTEAFLRNNAILQNIDNLDAKIIESLNEQMSPRFTNLQANYWFMVEKMLPIWQKSLNELK